MTCRHGKYDPSCSSYSSNMESLKCDYEKQYKAANEPDASNYEILTPCLP